tara:strand:+ start:883 stop:1284 length:402 start_codon:yes stop_codon:yes gene_type:complete
MKKNELYNNPRIIVVQKLYSNHFNKDTELVIPKNKFKKFIKDVVNGTIERKEVINELIDKELKDDVNENKTETIIKIMLMAAVYEFMFMHKTPIKVIISEYIKVSEFFIDSSKVSYLNAILDKISRKSRITDG